MMCCRQSSRPRWGGSPSRSRAARRSTYCTRVSKSPRSLKDPLVGKSPTSEPRSTSQFLPTCKSVVTQNIASIEGGGIDAPYDLPAVAIASGGGVKPMTRTTRSRIRVSQPFEGSVGQRHGDKRRPCGADHGRHTSGLVRLDAARRPRAPLCQGHASRSLSVIRTHASVQSPQVSGARFSALKHPPVGA